MEKWCTAIIQARMTSSRLPGKVLRKVMGRPLLSYQIERIRLSGNIDSILIATTTNAEDDAVEELAEREQVMLFRGSEADVLDRYYQAASIHEVRHIMRFTSDCPLVQPEICDLVAERYFETDVDYVFTGQSFAEGLDCEIFSFNALKRAWKGARLGPEREHVTLYFRNHPELFRYMILENRTDDSKYRITVDEDADFQVVKAVFEALYREKERYFGIGEIRSFLDAHPEIYRLNASILRNEGLLKSMISSKS